MMSVPFLIDSYMQSYTCVLACSNYAIGFYAIGKIQLSLQTKARMICLDTSALLVLVVAVVTDAACDARENKAAS